MVRCFVGIFIPEHVKHELIDLQKRILNCGVDGKLVEKENFHVSLSFLGDVENIDTVVKNLEKTVKNQEKFIVEIGEISTIPNQNFVRVIALNVGDPGNKLDALRVNVQKHVGGDSYKTHLTLCRVRNIEDKKIFIEKINKLPKMFGIFEVNSIQLIESRLSGNGPVYTIIKDFKLE